MRQNKKEESSFLGKGWNYPPAFSKDRETTSIAIDEDDIKQSIVILLSTIPGERIHRPDFGCGIHQMVYETINTSTITLIKHTIEKSIILFETRIELNDIMVDKSQEAEGLLSLQLVYTIRLTNTRSNVVYPFYFGEGTNIRS